MPTLISEEPDSYDIDYFYSKYKDRFGLVMNENKTSSLRVLAANIKPDHCETGKKKLHYFHVPTQPVIATCFCKTYHTYFTSRYFTLPQTTLEIPSAMDISPIISTKAFNRITEELIASPMERPTPTILFPIFNTDPTPKSIKPHSQHPHTCYICKTKNLPCVYTTDEKHSPDYRIATLFKTRLIHRSCIENITTTTKCKPLEQTKPFTKEQRGAYLTIKYFFATRTHNSKKEFFKHLLSIYAKCKQTPTPDKLLKQQQQQQQQKQQIPLKKVYQSKNKQKETENQTHSENNSTKTKFEPTFDWLKNFPITEEMETHKKLETPLSHSLFEFLKNHLYNFFPGKIIKIETKFRKEQRASFNYLIKQMAGLKPQFLTEIIFKCNPTTDKQATIPFNILDSTLRKLLLKFTTVLFTKLNYAEIFASPITIPPNNPKDRSQLCINIARLHLYLSNNYQGIDYKKFAEDFNFRPKRFNLTSETSAFDQQQKYLFLKHDNRFNIHACFNIPKSLFLEKFNIPSLKNSLEYFNTWFEEFFHVYNQQFSEPLNKEKVYFALKSQIRNHFVQQCTKLLLKTYSLIEPNSYNERRLECIKVSNHHILTCNNRNCRFLEIPKSQNTSSNQENEQLNQKRNHNFPALYKFSLNESYKMFPLKITEKDPWISPKLEETIFQVGKELEADLNKPIPLKLLDQLANEAENQTCKSNSVQTNPKRRNFYFYKYLTLYHNIAIQNHGLDNLSIKEAIDKITSKLIDTHFLARILTYYDLIKNKTPSFVEITKHYKEEAFPNAEKFLLTKFKIKFQEPTNLEDSLFLNSPFQ
jgi:hypothetical protein